MKASRERATYVAAAGAAVVTLLVFLPALRNGFVNWDDESNFILNTRYRGLGVANLSWMLRTFHMGPYQPLSWLTLAVDWTLWGLNPAGYHATSALLQAANAALLVVLVVRLLERLEGFAGRPLAAGAAVGALVWAVHPLRVESVVWATERRDVLSGLFVLLALTTYVRRPGAARPLVVALAALALLAKPSATVLPALLVVLDVYPLRRLGGATGWLGAGARRVWLEKVPLIALTASMAAVAVAGQQRVGALASLQATTPAARIGMFLYQSAFYLEKTVFPLRLSPLYEVPPNLGPLHPMAVAGALVLAGLATVAWQWRTRRPGLGAAIVAWVLAYLPTSGLAQVGVQVAADRYVYLAALAWAPLVAVAATPARGRLRLAVGVLVVLLFVPLTVRQVGVWHDSVTLWEHALALAPDSPIARLQLARAYLEADRVDDAVALYERRLREHPDSARSWSDYGTLLTAAGLPDRALPVLEKALALDPSDAGSWYARALIRDRQGDAPGALADYTESLRRDPAQGFAYNNRALVRAKLGDVPGALDDFARALTFEPVLNADTAFSVWANYGMLLARTGQVDAGIRAVRTAVALAPAEARGRLDDVLHQLEAGGDAG